MRTVTFVGLVGIADSLSAEAWSPEVINMLGIILVAAIVMDVVDFIRGKCK